MSLSQIFWEGYKEYIILAHDLRCKVIRSYSGEETDIEIDKEVWNRKKEKAIFSLKELGRVASNFGITIAVEDHAYTLTYLARQNLDMIKAVGLDSVKILYDQANLYMTKSEDYQKAVYTRKNYIAHCHIKDLIFEAGDNLHKGGNVKFIPMGSGEMNWDEIIPALQSIGYQGYLSYEYPRNERLPPADIEMRNALRYMKSCLK